MQESMPKNYDGVIHGYRKKGRLKAFGRVLLFLCVSVVLVISADMMSGWITGKSYGWSISIGKKKKQNTTIYVVLLGNYATQEEALEVARGSNVTGAGGYVYQDKDIYYVVGNVYPTKEEAENVVNNLQDTPYNVSYTEWKIQHQYRGNKDLAKDEILLIEGGFELLQSTFQELYWISNNLDTKVVTSIQASADIQDILTQYNVLQSKIEIALSSHLNEDMLMLHTKLIEVQDNLAGLVDGLLNDAGVGYIVKSCLIRHTKIWQSIGLVLS